MPSGIYPKNQSHPTPWCKGIKLSKKHIERLSQSHLGKQPWLGKKHKPETLIKMSLAKIGKKPPNWIEDRSKLAKRQERNDSAYAEWRKLVKIRDNWICKINNDDCDGKTIVHHILTWSKFPELRYDINNGITLCRFHHPMTREGEINSIDKFKSLI